jgi:amidophosphoribosyltransferase
MKEKCGVFAAYDLEGKRPVSNLVVQGLSDLQHRGQLSAGIMTYQPGREDKLFTYKGLGLVHEAFNPDILATVDLQGPAAIGHVRYATSGKRQLLDAQPFQGGASANKNSFGFVFNGNIANFQEVAEQLRAEGLQVKGELDTEVLMHLIARLKGEGKQAQELLSILAQKLDGAYSLITLDDQGDLLSYRDHKGFRPLSYTITRDNFLLVSSESNALQTHGSPIHMVEPGQSVQFQLGQSEVSVKQTTPGSSSHCYFEYVYFSHPTSTIDGVPVHQARFQLGKALAEIEDQTLDEQSIVVTVPDSARLAAEGFSEALGMPHREAIIRNTRVGRTFIEAEGREEKVRKKFSFIRERLHGQKVFLVEDSLVRGTTLKVLIQVMREQCQPAEIHLRIACPPLFSPCFYGVDIPSYKQLLARAYHPPLETGVLPPEVLEAMAKGLGVNSIHFLPVESLPTAIGMEANRLCRACINSDYPTDAGQAAAMEDLTK